jgi:hypothetical protein
MCGSPEMFAARCDDGSGFDGALKLISDSKKPFPAVVIT